MENTTRKYNMENTTQKYNTKIKHRNITHHYLFIFYNTHKTQTDL